MMLLRYLFPFSLLSASLVGALPRTSTPGYHLQTIYEFPNDTWVENLAVQNNGRILVTLITEPEVWEIDPFSNPAGARLIYRFPSALAASGISQYAPDAFAVNVGNFSPISDKATAGSWSVWALNMSSTTAQKITNISSAVLLNGMAPLPANPTTVLSADSGGGTIYSIDMLSANYKNAIQGPFLQPNTSAPLQLGVNDIQFRPQEPNRLYFDNSFKPPNFASVPIDASTGAQCGPVEIVYRRATYPTNFGFAGDDFTFDSSGQNAWVTTDPSNSLIKVNLRSGRVKVVAGGVLSKRLLGPTACRFGRTARDVKRSRLYVTTNGGLANPPPSGIIGGKFIAIDTAGFQI